MKAKIVMRKSAGVLASYIFDHSLTAWTESAKTRLIRSMHVVANRKEIFCSDLNVQQTDFRFMHEILEMQLLMELDILFCYFKRLYLFGRVIKLKCTGPWRPGPLYNNLISNKGSSSNLSFLSIFVYL